MKKMEQSRKWLTNEVLWQSELLGASRWLLGDLRNPFQLLCDHLLLFGLAICRQTLRLHLNEKMIVSQNPIQNSKFSVKRKNHGQQESETGG